MPSRDQFVSEVYVNGDQAIDALADLGKQLDKLKNQYANLNKNSKNYEARERELAAQIKSTEQAIATAEKGTESYGRAMENLSKRSINNLIKLQRQLNSEIKKLDPNDAEFEKLSKNYQEVTDRIKALQDAQRGITTGGGFIKNMAAGLSKYAGGIMIAFAAAKRVVGGFMEAYKTISNFEQANANLASILGATSDQMEKLEKAAIQLGSSTRYSASQVTGLQTELAKLGFTVKEITDMSPAVLNFAGSVGTDLASAAALAGVALRSFNLGSEQTEDALGTMAVACNKSALSFTYLQNSFSTIAPVAKTYGLSLKDTIALLGTLANAGFDASSAATATRNILLNLSDTNGKLAKALGGSVHSFEDIMAAMKKLRDQGVDLNTTLELTDKRSVAAFNTFLDGAESAMTLRGELENVDGELQTMADQRANTVEGAIDGMKSAWEGLVLSFRKSTGPIASVVNLLTKAIQKARTLVDPKGAFYQPVFDSAEEQFEQIMNWAAETGAKIEDVQSRLFDAAERMADKAKETAGGIWDDVAVSAIQNAYWDAADKAAKQAEEAEKKVLEVNAKYNAKQEAIYKERVQMLEKNSKAVGTKAWEDSEKRLEANRKEWDEALKDARRFKKEMDEIVSGDDSSTNNNTGGGGVDEKELKKQEAARKKAFADRKAQLEAFYNYETKMMKVKMLQGEMGEAEYNSAVYQAKAKYYEDMLALARKYGQDDTAIRDKMLDDHIKALEAEKKRVKVEMEEMMKVYATEHPDQNMSDEDFKKLLDNQRRQGYREKLGTFPGETDEEFDARIEQYEAFQEKILAKAADIRAAITEDSARTEYETEVAWAQKLAEQKKITAEEAERYILQAKLKYAQAAAQQVSQITEQASNFVAALKEAESAQLEAEYQRQLSAAGDNAEERERIEAEHEQKKLDLQKKYADVEMAVNIAKTIANGAGAAIRAWLDAGPFAGPILAALIAATTAAEVATIIAQRNAIKNASVSSSVSASSAPKTGERKITGYAEGGYTGKGLGTMGVTERPARPKKRGPSTGSRTGPSTGSGAAGSGDEEVVGVVHANEWVAPAWMVRQNPVMFANLEQYRRRGYAEGGYTGKGLGTMGVTERPARPPKRGPSTGSGTGPSTGSGTAGSGDGGIETIVRVAVREELPSALKALRVVLVRRDLTELDAQTEKFEEQTSR